jgi:hypothetical protein
MTSVVYKYPVDEVKMPRGAKVVHVGEQGGKPFLWALVDPDQPEEERTFIVLGTGQAVNGELWSHVGTFQQPPFVWHVFELVRT